MKTTSVTTKEIKKKTKNPQMDLSLLRIHFDFKCHLRIGQQICLFAISYIL